jgi:hypothetical protein
MTGPTGQPVTLFRVGGQGGLLDRVRVEGGVQGTLDTNFDRGEILLAVAEREDVVFMVPLGNEGDTFTLWTLDFKADRTGRQIFGFLRSRGSFPDGYAPAKMKVHNR